MRCRASPGVALRTLSAVRPSSTSSSDIPHDEPKANQVHDPSFARLFSDADLFGNILNSRTDHPEAGLTVEAQSVGDSLPVNGFSRLVAQDLDEHERAISEKFRTNIR